MLAAVGGVAARHKQTPWQMHTTPPLILATLDAHKPNTITSIHNHVVFLPQFKQVCDKLAAAGYLVAGPDIFRGKPWSMDRFPPKPEDNFMPWLQGYTWEVRTDHSSSSTGNKGALICVSIAVPFVIRKSSGPHALVPLCIMYHSQHSDTSYEQQLLDCCMPAFCRML